MGRMGRSEVVMVDLWLEAQIGRWWWWWCDYERRLTEIALGILVREYRYT